MLVVCGGNGEEKIVWSNLVRETARFPFFHTQLRLALPGALHWTCSPSETDGQTNTGTATRLSLCLMGKKKRPFVCLRVLTWINCFTGYEIELATWRAALIATFNRAYFSLTPFKRYLESVKQLWFPPTHWDLMILFISMQELGGDLSNNRPHIALRCYLCAARVPVKNDIIFAVLHTCSAIQENVWLVSQ